MSKKTLIVVGAGKGLGNAVAKEFASHDFRVVLIARNEEHLQEYKKEFEAEGIETYVKAWYEGVAEYLEYDDQGMILAKGCGNVETVVNSPYFSEAYRLGKNL